MNNAYKIINHNFDGQIIVPVYVTDSEGADSEEIFNCEIEIFPVNDVPYFSNEGDITIDEDCENNSCEDGDVQYERVWAYDISPGADNEEQDIMFILNFNDLSLIENYSITPDGLLIIETPAPKHEVFNYCDKVNS